MIKRYQSNGTFILEVELSDTEFMKATGRKVGVIPKRFPDDYAFSKAYATAVEKATVVEYVEPSVDEEEEATPTTVIVPRMAIIDRLNDLGKFEDALTVLKSNSLLEQKWYALTEGVYADDEDISALLTAIGVEPSTVLY